MRSYRHLTLEEREDIMMLRRDGESVSEIARSIGRDKSTVSRELSRNSCEGSYRASAAQRRSDRRREACRRPRVLDDPAAIELVRSKICAEHWSPQQIEGRLRLEGSALQVSDTTIYRAIGSGSLDRAFGCKASSQLRHKGKRRHHAGDVERRGKIKVSHEISERPPEAEARSRLGDWEADTVAGRGNGACLVTLVDRKSRYLVGGKAAGKKAAQVNKRIRIALRGQRLKSVTPDRGKEFARHAEVTELLGVEFYFAAPHHPWQRGTNENTNGLLREYFPKGKPLEKVGQKEVQRVFDELNKRPRKCLGYRTPYEVYHSETLHLI